MFKKTLLTLATATMIAGMAQAETNYNYKDGSHKADKECIAIMSLVKDALHQVGDTETFKEVVILQDKLILKYAYSKQLNTHVEVYKMLLKQKISEGYDVSSELIGCMTMAGRI